MSVIATPVPKSKTKDYKIDRVEKFRRVTSILPIISMKLNSSNFQLPDSTLF